MSSYRLTPAAQRDLSSIWDYSVDEWDARQAEKYIREIQGAVERIAADPDRGCDRGDVRPGYRSYASGRHVIFFRARPGGVCVIRILHERMGADRHL